MLAEQFCRALQRHGVHPLTAIGLLRQGVASGQSIKDVVPRCHLYSVCSALGVGPHTTLRSLFDTGQGPSTGMGQTALQQQIINSAAQYGVPASLALAVAQAESAFNPNAISPAGAVGVMQVMPTTAGMSTQQLQDPTTNIDAGMSYLSSLINQYGGDIGTALAAYNAGPGRVAAGTVPSSTYSYVNNVENLASTTYAGYGSTGVSTAVPTGGDAGATDGSGLLSAGLFDGDSSLWMWAGLGIIGIVLVAKLL